jgi:alkylation response protein AidB-like acyl-CoA dehydrogenase
MDFKLTEEERMIKEVAREIVAREIAPEMDAHDRDRPLSKEAMLKIYASLGPLGLNTHLLPEEEGGSELSYIAYGLILEELPVEVAFSAMAHERTIARILQWGNPEQRKRFLPGLVESTKIASFGVSEPNAGSDPRSVETRAEIQGDTMLINGTKLWITNATISDLMVAVVSLGKGGNQRNTTTRVVIEREISPYSAVEVEAIGMKQGHLCEVTFEDCRVPLENRLGETGDTNKALGLIWLANRPLVGLMAVGMAQKALDACIAYVGQRKQFGRKIGEFQLVQQMLSEIAVRIDASRLLCYRALTNLDDGVTSAKEASMAKWFATENCLAALKLAIQVHGTIGLTREADIERLYRNAIMLTFPDGTSQIQQLIIGRELTGISAIRG